MKTKEKEKAVEKHIYRKRTKTTPIDIDTAPSPSSPIDIDAAPSSSSPIDVDSTAPGLSRSTLAEVPAASPSSNPSLIPAADTTLTDLPTIRPPITNSHTTSASLTNSVPQTASNPLPTNAITPFQDANNSEPTIEQDQNHQLDNPLEQILN